MAETANRSRGSVQSPEMVKKVHPLVKWAAYLPPEQGAPKADEQPVMYLAVVQDSSIPGDLNTDTGIALANITLAAWAKGVGSCIMGAINKPALSELLGIAAPDIRPIYRASSRAACARVASAFSGRIIR